MSANVGSLMVEIGADVARLRKDMGKAAQIAQNQSRAMSRHLSGISDAAGKVSMAINAIGVAGAGLGVGYLVKQFADLDAGLVGVKKTTGLTGAELQGLGSDIQQITTELPLTTQELLAIAQSAGQLGVTGRANILKFTKTVGMLGTASDLVGEEAATSLARILNVTNESAESVDVLGSVIVALGNQMAATESEIAKMATEVAQATGVFDVSSAEAAALGATLKSLGVRAELGGSSVGRAFRAIDASIRGGGESFEELQRITGITGDKLRQTFAVDSVAVFQAFIAGLGRMIGQGASAAEVLGRFGLKGEEVLKSLPVLAKRSDELARALGISAKETKNATALTEEALQASKSFSAQMRITGNVIDVIAADIGRELAPAILDVTRDFRDWTSANRDFLKEDVGGAIREITSGISGAKKVISDLPDFVVGAGGMGLVGWALFGPYGAAFAAMITAAGAAVKALQDAVRIDASNGLNWTEEFSLWLNDLEHGTNTLETMKRQMADMTKATPHIFRGTVTPPPPQEKKTNSPGGVDIERDTATGLPAKEYKHDFDAHLSGWQKYQDDKKRALEKFDRDFKRITLGETKFAIAEAKARSEQLQELVKGDAEKIAQIKQWEARRITEINEEAAENTKTAWEDYADHSMDQMRNMDSLANTVGRNLEDSFTAAFTGAEMSAMDFFNTIYAEMVRISVARPLAGAITGGIGDILGSLFHSGGVVGSGGTTKHVSASAFVGAPRYHSGGVAGLAPDEVPAILQRGEVVLSREQVRGASGGGNMELRVIVQNDDGGTTQMQQAGQEVSFDGEKMVATLWLRAVRNNTANLGDTLRRGI